MRSGERVDGRLETLRLPPGVRLTGERERLALRLAQAKQKLQQQGVRRDQSRQVPA